MTCLTTQSVVKMVKIAKADGQLAASKPLTCGFPGSPDRIRTGATALRGRRARPLHNGATMAELSAARIITLPNAPAGPIELGYQDSNLD